MLLLVELRHNRHPVFVAQATPINYIIASHGFGNVALADFEYILQKLLDPFEASHAVVDTPDKVGCTPPELEQEVPDSVNRMVQFRFVGKEVP